MKSEIDRDFYCAAGTTNNEGNCWWNVDEDFNNVPCLQKQCELYHRKWPTPEQYKAEYGKDYPDDGAVYALVYTNALFAKPDTQEWRGYDGKELWRLLADEHLRDRKVSIVCACTPWGKPPDDWRPE